MLKIRLQRIGRRNDPSFRVVVTEHTRGSKSEKHVDRVGFYNPKTKEQKLEESRIQHWLGVGAQASGTVHNMLVKAGVVKGKTINVLPKKTPIVTEKPEEAPAAEAPANPPAGGEEAPAATPSAEETAPEEVASAPETVEAPAAEPVAEEEKKEA